MKTDPPTTVIASLTKAVPVLTSSDEIIEDEEALKEAIRDFVAATPPADSPLSAFREGLEALCGSFPVPSDAEIERIDANGVPALRVQAPGVDASRVIIHLHSGGYFMGSAQGYREFAYRLSAATNAAVIVPDYRLAPEHPFPAALNDSVSVYAFARDHWATSSIAISGDSAGGGLAMASLMKMRDDGIPLPAGGVTISAALDLQTEAESLKTNAATDPIIDGSEIGGLASLYAGDTDPGHPYCSPINGDKKRLPPLLVMVSDAEVLRDDSVRLVREVQEAGGEATIFTPTGTVHIWTLFPKLRQAAASLELIGEFLNRVWASQPRS